MSAIDASYRHVTDPASGLAYLLPPGWRERAQNLFPPFTRAISDGAGSMVGSGRWDPLTVPPSTDELIASAARLASEYGEFFLPADGDRLDVLMEGTVVGGRPAGRAGYRLRYPEAREPAYVRALVVALAPGKVSFLLAVSPASCAPTVESVLTSATPILG